MVNTLLSIYSFSFSFATYLLETLEKLQSPVLQDEVKRDLSMVEECMP